MNFLFNLLNESVDEPTATINWPFLLICIGAVVILMVISSRQRRKQQEAANAKLNNIKIGDQVKTIGLIYGEIVEIDTDMETFVIKTGTEDCPSYIKVDKMAIYQVIPPLSEVVQEPSQESNEAKPEQVFEEKVEDNIENKPEEKQE
ncbi:MAG: preprotein translocase subunit YajC [Clostridia bacterium]|nr:preprotein translocase subunit YajC [Clostridia bacterium]